MERMMREAEVLSMDKIIAITPTIKDMFGEIGVGAIAAPDASEQETREYAEVIANKYLVPTDKSKPSCCIDGRACVHTLSGKESVPGPKISGGALITTYASAELSGWFETNDPREVEARVKQVARTLHAAGIAQGGHCDTIAAAANFTKGKTGCGANDRLLDIVANIGTAPEFILGGSQALMSQDTYKPERAEVVVRQSVSNPVKEWSTKTMIDILATVSADNIEVLEHADTATGGHEEALVVWNNIPNTTVDRDRLLKDGYSMVFVVDAWYIDDLATAAARGPEAVEQRELLKHAMVAYQLGTYMTLGDGSHRIAVINQN